MNKILASSVLLYWIACSVIDVQWCDWLLEQWKVVMWLDSLSSKHCRHPWLAQFNKRLVAVQFANRWLWSKISRIQDFIYRSMVVLAAVVSS